MRKSLEHLERLLRARRWKGPIDLCQLGGAQPQLRRTEVVLDTLRVDRLWNRNDVRLADTPCQSNLRGTQLALLAEFAQLRLLREGPLAKGRIRHRLNAVLALP